MSALRIDDHVPASPFPSPLAAVFLDAGGTLITERRGRAAIYSACARSRRLDVDEAAMARSMGRALRELPRSIGPSFRFTRGWFEAFIERIFVHELGLPRAQLAGVQAELFERFADPSEYVLTPGALELVELLAARGVVVGVVSNWSAALPGLLQGLGLSGHLDFVLVSALCALEKPERAFFELALRRAGVAAGSALHVGNDPELDVQAALAAGILPVLVGDAPLAPELAAVTRVPDLAELARRLSETRP